MKKIVFVVSVLLSLFMAVSSCKKKEGCTDNKAINFDVSAEKNNNTCVYKGNATFWNDFSSSDDVIVQMADGTTGVITRKYASAPSCGTTGCFTYSNVPGTYSFIAEELIGSGTWSGSVTITSNGCVTFLLY